MAETAEAGAALLGARLGQGGKIVTPVDNLAARHFLAAQGWREERRAWRMRRGPALAWEPRQLWARIGGKFG